MFVPVVQVRQVWMAVRYRRVLVPVCMRLGTLVAAVRVLVVLVVDVPVIVY
jgi:hypothetical protein